MESYIWVISFAIILFVAMVVSLAVKPKIINKISFVIALIVCISGFILYGYGYDYVNESKTVAIIQTIIAVSKMFVGYDTFEDIKFVPLFQDLRILTYFYIIHFLGFYASASAIITKFGSNIIRKFKIFLLRFNDLVLIYGYDKNTLEFANELSECGYKSILFVDDTLAKSNKYIIRNDSNALNGNVKFLKSIGLGRRNRKIYIYALKNPALNMKYALNLKQSFEKRKTKSENIKMTLLGNSNTLCYDLVLYKDKHGYADISVIEKEELSARLLIQKYPPCSVISFDKNGKALNDFNCLIIGFGKTGQQVLKKLVQNGQFEGNRFHATVVSLNYKEVFGKISFECSKIFDKYDINFLDKDARSEDFYKYLNDKINLINYIVVCTGNDELNQEISDDLIHYCNSHDNHSFVIQCNKNGLLYTNENDIKYESFQLYSKDVLVNDALDRVAMLLNHNYTKGSSVQEDWKHCDYFSRMSSRASADYIDTIIRASGLTRNEIMRYGFNVTNEMLTNLGKHEHLRWCAFHYVMGYDQMDEIDFENRIKRYLNGEQIKLTRDSTKRTHACLCDWDDLNKLSSKVKEMTGEEINYQRLDIDNVLMIPELLRKI